MQAERLNLWWQWKPGLLMPSNEEMARDDAAVDVRRITFSSGTVWAILGSVAALLISVLMAWGDVRDIKSNQLHESEKRALEQRLIDERLANLRSTMESTLGGLTKTVDAMQRRQELQQYEIQGLKEMMLKSQAEIRR